MLAHLSLIFLFQLVELSLVSVEIVIVVLLSEMSKNFTWRIVEVSWSAVSIVSLSFISLFLGLSGSKLGFSALTSSSRWLGK